MEDVGFQFEAEQIPHHQRIRETELKFIHPQLINRLGEDGFRVRARKFYIKPLTDEPGCEIGLVIGKSTPLSILPFFTKSNSFDSYGDGENPAWTNRDDNPALDNLLISISNYLKSSAK
jgi:hypothetical protein